MTHGHPSQSVDLVVTVHRETDKAVLVSTTGKWKDAAWIARSQIEQLERCIVGAFEDKHDMTAKAWILREKGLIE